MKYTLIRCREVRPQGSRQRFLFESRWSTHGVEGILILRDGASALIINGEALKGIPDLLPYGF